MYDSTRDKKKYRRLQDRNIDNFPDEYWRKGYEFEGVPCPEYDQVEEYTEEEVLNRIHILSHLEEI